MAWRYLLEISFSSEWIIIHLIINGNNYISNEKTIALNFFLLVHQVLSMDWNLVLMMSWRCNRVLRRVEKWDFRTKKKRCGDTLILSVSVDLFPFVHHQFHWRLSNSIIQSRKMRFSDQSLFSVDRTCYSSVFLIESFN